MTFDAAAIAALPKVLLHDHLDGGLRPRTIVELAEGIGYSLPVSDAEGLAGWFLTAAGGLSGDGETTGSVEASLETYLETFAVTTAVMQTHEGLRRVAREAAIDLAADGVVYAEQRFAPEQHVSGGLGLQEVLDAVLAGFAEGVSEAALDGRTIRIGTLLTAMRQNDRWEELAGLTIANRENGVVGFDLAGPEAGFSPTRHPHALRMLREASMPVTLHAGEADGLASIAAAVHRGGALRIGHGVRIMDDIEVTHDAGATFADRVESASLGYLAHWVRDGQIPLEVCPTSNVQTGAALSVAEHPITLLKALGFAVTVNTDNRLQSGTSQTAEMTHLVEEAGWTLDDLRDVTLDAAWNTFIHHDERQGLVDDQILPGFTEQNEGRHRA